MNKEKYKNKNILIAGLGKTGRSALDIMAGQGAVLGAYDAKDIEKSETELFAMMKERGVKMFLNGADVPDEKWDVIVISPGVNPDMPFIERAVKGGAKLIGDLELAAELTEGCPCSFIGITGTNGKTTTTSLVGEIYKLSGRQSAVTGNIGVPVLESIASELRPAASPCFITEISSFQLETTGKFHPEIAAILNLTPDHLDRHGTMEAYGAAKARIFMNQDEGDYLIYNLDDPAVCELVKTARSTLYPFSARQRPATGAYVKNGMIVLRGNPAQAKNRESDMPEQVEIELIAADKLKIPGAHNLENALAAAAIAHAGGIEPETIARALAEFEGVAHRMELISTVGGVKFINDSKGTNPDASLKAIQASDTGILLIAGGFEKGSDFRPFISKFDGKVKQLLLMGETKDRFAREASEVGFNSYTICDDLPGCVGAAYGLAAAGDTVMLSPASASWDMYKNFEVRGEHFRSLVKKLEEDAEQ